MEDESGEMHVEDLLMPEERGPAATESDVTFHLFTQSNQYYSEVVRGTDFEDLLKSQHFKKEKKIKFIIHGWNNHKDSLVNNLIKAALFVHHDINVFVVDWKRPANKFYTTSKSAVPIVGRIVGDFINYIIDEFDHVPMDFSLVGHSLGAHISGCAGARVNTKHGLVDYIVGLDPASPLFTYKNINNRVDPTDAQFVSIIHTNGGFLGWKSAIGDADYFPNGGGSQPGCGFDIAGTCAHSRAIEFFAESIRTSGFTAHICDGIKVYDKGHCDGNDRSWMGEFDVDRTAEGDYFLRTASKAPFALGASRF